MYIPTFPPLISVTIGRSLRGASLIAKFVASSFVGMLAIVRDEDGVDASIGDGSRALTSDEDGLASVGGGDNVGATSRGLTGIETEDGDGVDDGRLSQGGNSPTTYRLFFPVVPFPLE